MALQEEQSRQTGSTVAMAELLLVTAGGAVAAEAPRCLPRCLVAAVMCLFPSRAAWMAVSLMLQSSGKAAELIGYKK